MSLYSWLPLIPDDHLAELLYGLSGSEGMPLVPMYRKALEECWRRFGRRCNVWPVGSFAGLKILYLCAKGRGISDPTHRPVRTMTVPAYNQPSQGLPYAGFETQGVDWYECSCGTKGTRTDLQWVRSPTQRSGWPLVVDGKAYVCKNIIADGVVNFEHPRHGFIGSPSDYQRCMCGAVFSWGDFRELSLAQLRQRLVDVLALKQGLVFTYKATNGD